jgi:hypothetical protein
MLGLYYCYIFRDPKTKIPRYVGKGINDRVWTHIDYPSNTRTDRMLAKRHREGYACVPEIIYCKNEGQAFSLEMWFIWKYGRDDQDRGTLFNLTDGGDGLTGISEETRLKMSIAKTKYLTGRKHTAERRKRQGQRMKGVPNIAASKKLQKRCTVDGITIFPSVSALVAALGNGKNGVHSPNLKFL